MAPISACLLIIGLVATFMSVRRISSLALRGLERSLASKGGREGGLLSAAKDALGNNRLYARATRFHEKRKRKEAIQLAMPEAIRLLCVSLESGSSLENGLRYAASNCPEPLSSELKRAVWDIEAGHSFDSALEDLRHRTDDAEFAFLSVAMEIQHRSGGSLTPILDNLATLLKQSSELKEDLRTKTEQARLSSRIVAIMPFLLLGVLSLLSPGYLSAFFGSALGMCLLVLALAFELLGIILVRRCLAIDFSVDYEEAI